MFAAYNRWANERLYEAAAKLPDADYRAERGAFFGSLHGTLNHILVADRVWMRRFTGEGPTPTRLDEILFDTLEPLAAARRDEDERIIAWVEGLSEADLAGTFTYRTLTRPTDVTQPLRTGAGAFLQPPDPPSRSVPHSVDDRRRQDRPRRRWTSSTSSARPG